jgi:DNA-3-methyladenine glycosylase
MQVWFRVAIQAKYNKMQKLQSDFYRREDVVQIARELIGKLLISRLSGQTVVARIVETEAYAGAADAASHAYRNRRTKRTEVLFAAGGTSYVYLCYGMHYLFNVVTGREGIPDAVLIRGVEPIEGGGKLSAGKGRQPGAGPAMVSRLMGITLEQNGWNLVGNKLYLAEEKDTELPVAVSPRIGVDYAGGAAKWLYRLYVPDHPHVTPHKLNRKGIVLV